MTEKELKHALNGRRGRLALAMDSVKTSFGFPAGVAVLVGCDRPAPVRVDGAGEPRLIAIAPDLDDLLRLGFEQVRIAAAEHPTISSRMLVLLDLIGHSAADNRIESEEIRRQRRLIEPNAR